MTETNSTQPGTSPMTENRQNTPGTAPTVPHVVIVGGGFGGLTAAKKLGKQPVKVTLIDRNNYHLFQPMIYQVATSGLAPADIAAPIRDTLHKQKNTTVLLEEVTGVDGHGSIKQLFRTPGMGKQLTWHEDAGRWAGGPADHVGRL